jgi:hypothetical protein
VIASAVIPTIVANTFFLPRHLLPRIGASAPTAHAAIQPAVVEE